MGNPKADRARAAAANSSRAKRRRLKPLSDLEQEISRTDMGSMGRCWCGETSGHDWPGKAAGKPHPREAT